MQTRDAQPIAEAWQISNFDTQIVFDTDCVLCSGLVHFVIRHEKAPTIQFVGAWSAAGLALAAAHGLSEADLNETFLVVENERGLIKSEAAFAILAHLRPPWPVLRVLRVVPRPLRDAIYSIIARRRYRWFGHKVNCFLAPAGMRDRFVDR